MSPCMCVYERDKLLSKNHFLLHLMTRIINIIFSELLGVLSPTGMLCLPGFQPRFEYLLELLDLKEEFAWPCFSWCKCLLDATEGDRTPSAQPRCTSDPQQDKLHEPAILCMQETVSISISLWSQKPQLWGMRQLPLLDRTQLSCPENPSLTTKTAAGYSLP